MDTKKVLLKLRDYIDELIANEDNKDNNDRKEPQESRLNTMKPPYTKRSLCPSTPTDKFESYCGGEGGCGARFSSFASFNRC